MKKYFVCLRPEHECNSTTYEFESKHEMSEFVETVASYSTDEDDRLEIIIIKEDSNEQ